MGSATATGSEQKGVSGLARSIGRAVTGEAAPASPDAIIDNALKVASRPPQIGGLEEVQQGYRINPKTGRQEQDVYLTGRQGSNESGPGSVTAEQQAALNKKFGLK